MHPGAERLTSFVWLVRIDVCNRVGFDVEQPPAFDLSIEFLRCSSQRKLDLPDFVVREYESLLSRSIFRFNLREVVEDAAGVVDDIADDEREVERSFRKPIDSVDALRTIRLVLRDHSVGTGLEEPLNGNVEILQVLACAGHFQSGTQEWIVHHSPSLLGHSHIGRGPPTRRTPLSRLR
jgi:hypothetical protein